MDYYRTVIKLNHHNMEGRELEFVFESVTNPNIEVFGSMVRLFFHRLISDGRKEIWFNCDQIKSIDVSEVSDDPEMRAEMQKKLDKILEIDHSFMIEEAQNKE